MAKQIPKKKRLIGRSHEGDIYETRGKQIWMYSGTELKHWKMKSFWRKLR